MDWFANLFGLSFFAELAFDPNITEEKLNDRFSATTGGDRQAFHQMSNYFNDFSDPDRFKANFKQRFLGDAVLWQDVLDGMFDTHLFAHPMSAYYEKNAEQMRRFYDSRPDDPWRYLYDLAVLVFEALAKKAFIAERLQPAYQNGDKEMLRELAEAHLPLLAEKIRAVHNARRRIWMAHNSTVGWGNLDIRYAGVAARAETARELILAYLAGERTEIESLAEVRLEKPLSAFRQYPDFASVIGIDA